MFKKRFIYIVIPVVLVNARGLGMSVLDFAAYFPKIFDFYNAGGWFVVDGALFLAIFLGITQSVLGNHFQGKSGKTVATALGISLVYAESTAGLRLLDFGLIGALFLSAILGYAVYAMSKRMVNISLVDGSLGLISALLLFVAILRRTVDSSGEKILSSLGLTAPLLDELLAFLFVIAVFAGVLFGLFYSFGGSTQERGRTEGTGNSRETGRGASSPERGNGPQDPSGGGSPRGGSPRTSGGGSSPQRSGGASTRPSLPSTPRSPPSFTAPRPAGSSRSSLGSSRPSFLSRVGRGIGSAASAVSGGVRKLFSRNARTASLSAGPPATSGGSAGADEASKIEVVLEKERELLVRLNMGITLFVRKTKEIIVLKREGKKEGDSNVITAANDSKGTMRLVREFLEDYDLSTPETLLGKQSVLDDRIQALTTALSSLEGRGEILNLAYTDLTTYITRARKTIGDSIVAVKKAKVIIKLLEEKLGEAPPGPVSTPSPASSTTDSPSTGSVDSSPASPNHSPSGGAVVPSSESADPPSGGDALNSGGNSASSGVEVPSFWDKVPLVGEWRRNRAIATQQLASLQELANEISSSLRTFHSALLGLRECGIDFIAEKSPLEELNACRNQCYSSFEILREKVDVFEDSPIPALHKRIITVYAGSWFGRNFRSLSALVKSIPEANDITELQKQVEDAGDMYRVFGNDVNSMRDRIRLEVVDFPVWESMDSWRLSSRESSGEHSSEESPSPGEDAPALALRAFVIEVDGELRNLFSALIEHRAVAAKFIGKTATDEAFTNSWQPVSAAIGSLRSIDAEPVLARVSESVEKTEVNNCVLSIKACHEFAIECSVMQEIAQEYWTNLDNLGKSYNDVANVLQDLENLAGVQLEAREMWLNEEYPEQESSPLPPPQGSAAKMSAPSAASGTAIPSSSGTSASALDSTSLRVKKDLADKPPDSNAVNSSVSQEELRAITKNITQYLTAIYSSLLEVQDLTEEAIRKGNWENWMRVRRILSECFVAKERLVSILEEKSDFLNKNVFLDLTQKLLLLNESGVKIMRMSEPTIDYWAALNESGTRYNLAKTSLWTLQLKYETAQQPLPFWNKKDFPKSIALLRVQKKQQSPEEVLRARELIRKKLEDQGLNKYCIDNLRAFYLALITHANKLKKAKTAEERREIIVNGMVSTGEDITQKGIFAVNSLGDIAVMFERTNDDDWKMRHESLCKLRVRIDEEMYTELRRIWDESAGQDLKLWLRLLNQYASLYTAECNLLNRMQKVSGVVQTQFEKWLPIRDLPRLNEGAEISSSITQDAHVGNSITTRSPPPWFADSGAEKRVQKMPSVVRRTLAKQIDALYFSLSTIRSLFHDLELQLEHEPRTKSKIEVRYLELRGLLGSPALKGENARVGLLQTALFRLEKHANEMKATVISVAQMLSKKEYESELQLAKNYVTRSQELLSIIVRWRESFKGSVPRTAKAKVNDARILVENLYQELTSHRARLREMP